MAYLPSQQSAYEAQERRKKHYMDLLRQAVSPTENQVVSGRVVPYSPIQGLSKIAQALIARQGLAEAESRQSEIDKEYETGRAESVQKITDLLTGRPEQPYQLSPEEQFGDEQIPGLRTAEVKADPMQAMIQGTVDPYLQGTGIDRVAAAMLKPKGSGSQARPIPTSRGYMRQDETGNWVLMTDEKGQPYKPVPADVILAQQKKEAEALGKGEAEKELDKPKRESAVDAATEKKSILSTLISKAKDQAKGFTTTGFVGQLSSGIGGTPAHDLKNTLDTIRANIGFDKLQEMRANSPTGGALGQVSERENELLQAVWSSVQQSQSEDQLIENLNAVERQVEESWKRIKEAYKKDYGKEYSEESEAKPTVLRFDSKGNAL